MSVYIIAEAGVNHNGNIHIARQLVDKAAEAGVDCIKFQTFKPEKLVSKYAEKASYQKETTDENENQLEMLRKLILKDEEYKDLAEYAGQKRLDFCSTPFDLDSLAFLKGIKMPFWKIPSGEITNYPYLKAIAETKLPVVMSTGMANLEEVRRAVDVLSQNGTPRDQIVVLQCNTQYPTPYEDVNLRAMVTMKNELGVRVGYSDHTKGIEIPIAAVAMSAEIIEKHFTLDRNMEGPDHKASLEPDELKAMVMSIRHIEAALGNGVKAASPSEKDNLSIVRKSIIAKKKISKGELLTDDNITTKRPGTGITPMRWNEVLGTQAIRGFEEDELIEV